MAKRVSLKNLTRNKKDTPKKNVSTKIDNSREAILERAKFREQFPPVSYVNTFQVVDLNFIAEYTIDLSDLVKKYPNNKSLIEQLIVGLNQTIKPGQSRGTCYQKEQGIRRFIEFLNAIENLSNTDVVNIADITLTVTLSFSNYLLSKYPKHGSKTIWYSAIEQIFERLQELYPNNPLIKNDLLWAPAPRRIRNFTQGYLPREMYELINACKRDIVEIKRFHATYRTLDQELVDYNWTIENLMYHIHYHLVNDKDRHGCTERGYIRRILLQGGSRYKRTVADFLQENGYTIEQIQDLYYARGPELAKDGRDTTPTQISSTPKDANLQFNLALGTFKKYFPDFPYYYPISDSKPSITKHHNYGEIYGTWQSKDPLWQMTCRAQTQSCTKINFMNAFLGSDAVFAGMHFVFDTIYPFMLLCLINSGWNLESILSISDNVDKHITPDWFDSDNFVVIIGLKKGGQTEGPKKVYHRSPKNNTFGVYRLLKYVESIVTQYQDSPHYLPGYLWQYTNYQPGSVRSVFLAINEILEKLSYALSQRFVKRHQFEYISDRAIDHERIRPGYVALKQLMGSDFAQLTNELDHKLEETIIHYTSDESSNMVIDLRLKQVQKQFVDDITNFKVRIVNSQSLEKLRKAINDAQTEQEKRKLLKEQSKITRLSEKTIVHLLDSGSQKYILSCENSKKPTWPGADEYVNAGQKCTYFNKCCLCQQAVVFPEALPFVARRIIDLEKKQSNLPSANWIIKYGDEYDAWKQVLDIWNNEEQVKDAWGQARAGFVVLPDIMRGV